MSKTVSDWIEAEIKLDPELRGMVQEESLNADIAVKVYNARKESGLTQVALAKLVKTKQGQISRLEDADYQGHSLTMLKRVFDALGKQLLIKTPSKTAPCRDSALSFGGRLRDYIPFVEFASQRLSATFPAEIQSELLIAPGCVGVIEADRNYEGHKEPFGDFSLPFIREAMLSEIQNLKKSGGLRPKLAHVPVNFADQYTFSEKKHGISRAIAKWAIEGFDQFHSVKLCGGTDKGREVLLFTKSKTVKKKALLYLVVAHQYDHELTVSEAYRLDSRIEEGLLSMSPLQVLEALTEKFGIELRIGRQRSRLILNQSLKVNTFNNKSMIKFNSPPKHSFLLSTLFGTRLSEDGKKMADFSMAYCIDTTKYCRWLGKLKTK